MNKNQGSTKVEQALVGRRVQIRSLDWQRTITGTLVKCERYLYVLKQDSGGFLCILKHACSAISAAKSEEEST
jgi:hypothetical protein